MGAEGHKLKVTRRRPTRRRRDPLHCHRGKIYSKVEGKVTMKLHHFLNNNKIAGIFTELASLINAIAFIL